MISPDHSADRRVVRRLLALLTCALALGALGFASWEYLQSRPSLLDQAIMLAEAEKLDEAELKVRAYLKKDPDRDAAHLLLSQIILERKVTPSTPAGKGSPEAAQEALNHLSKVRPYNPRMAVAFQLSRGKALDQLLRFDEAEVAWLEALKVDPTAPEAGLNLLNLYYMQVREEEARRLALRLFHVQTDPHDRVQLLLKLVELDARPAASGSLARGFEPVVRQRPGELHCALALGLALTRIGDVEQGIDQLHRVIQAHPEYIEARDCLLTALDESGQIEGMEEELERMPADLAQSPRLTKHRAKIAQDVNWKQAVELYRQAQVAEPYNRVVEYRLSRALRHVGETAEADRIENRLRRRDVANEEIRPLYDQAIKTSRLGTRPNAELYQRIAEARERMQLLDEVRAWHQLVLQDDPNNKISKAALARLGDEGDAK
jgi:tetratricopeptide (TPR) repeat protein